MLEGEEGKSGSLIVALFVDSPPTHTHTHTHTCTHKNGNKAMFAMIDLCPFQNLGDNLQNTKYPI